MNLRLLPAAGALLLVFAAALLGGPRDVRAQTPDETSATYTVQAGDTLATIAARYGTSVTAIAQASGIANVNVIDVGQVLAIPGAAPTEGSDAAPPPRGEPDEGSDDPADESVDATRVSLLRIVDKERALPSGYAPTDLVSLSPIWTTPGFGTQELREPARDALMLMLWSARAEGHEVRVRSSYRSYDLQRITHQQWVARMGEEQALRVSAPAGHSEHQLGTAVDLTSAAVGWGLERRFGETAAGTWLHDHADEYGFALSYPEGGEAVTGYAYEPWHFRYIGERPADQRHESGLTLIEYLELIEEWKASGGPAWW